MFSLVVTHCLFRLHNVVSSEQLGNVFFFSLSAEKVDINVRLPGEILDIDVLRFLSFSISTVLI